MTTRKQRHHLYLSDGTSATLEALGDAPGASKSSVAEAAIDAWARRSAGNALDDRFALRLDRLSLGQEQTRRDIARLADTADFLSEAFVTFVQHQLTLVAHQPAFTPEAAHLGQARFRQFIEAVGRKLARRRAARETDAGTAPGQET
jgi:hypothetical protein